jgi:mono/diheme cytochrome c family protein
VQQRPRKLRAIPSQNKFWVINMQARPSTNISDNDVSRILAYLAYDSSRQMSTVMDQNPADPMIAEGRQFFLTQNCNACHTVGADTASGGPPLDNVGHTRTRQQLLDRIKKMCSGTDKTMPPLPSDTPDEQINSLVDYLQTLKGKA